MEFLEYDVVIRDLGQIAIAEIKEVFTGINSTNYAPNAIEVQNARYHGAFKEFGEEVSRDGFFERHRVFGPADIRRMHDLRFVLTLVVTVMSTYFHRDDELDEYLGVSPMSLALTVKSGGSWRLFSISLIDVASTRKAEFGENLICSPFS